MPVVLYPKDLYHGDDSVERAVYGPDVTVRVRHVPAIADLTPEDCTDVEGLMTLGDWIRAEDLPKFPRLRVVVRMGVGYDRVDRAACAARGITVCNVPDYGTMEVAEHAVVTALALRRGLFLYHDTQRADPPAPWAFMPSPLVRRSEVQTFGLIGMGRIGTAAALRAKAFGFRVVFYDPYKPNGHERGLGLHRVRHLDDLLRQSDILSLHVPLTPQTKGMLGLRELSLLPDNAIIVNTARGPMIDLDALATLLKSGKIAGAGLDVFDPEPTLDGDPLLKLDNVVVTPHLAGLADEVQEALVRSAVAQCGQVLAGERPPRLVNPEVWDKRRS